MAKQTDTRRRAREVALLMLERGEKPTSWNVRQALGGGSPNTIADEVKKVLAEQGLAKPVEEPSRDFVNDAHRTLKDILADLRESADQLKLAAKERHKFSEAMAALEQRLNEQQSKFQELISTTNSLMAKFETQLEGVRKHMLMSIEEARQETRMWKEAAQRIKEESAIWRSSLDSKILALTEERAALRAKLELCSRNGNNSQ